MKLITVGISRTVLLIGKYAFKFPVIYREHSHFLNGCRANWHERKLTKDFEDFAPWFNKINPTLYCSWFGLVSIQKRIPILERELTDEEKKDFEAYCGQDNHRYNFGYLNGQIVCIDYE